ncbi:killer toxin [Xylaria digitata]|nr:killer toxin [Xylaria digitata]
MARIKAIITSTLILLANTHIVEGLGINCRGSTYCFFDNDKINLREADTLRWFINAIDAGRWYNNGEQIACTPAQICAFLQNTGGTWGSKIKQLAPYIPNHGCTSCGSVPYYYPEGNNNVADGQLTFNYVSSPKCENGLC